MKAIIIGSGMSGLTAGAYLARAGWQVTIYEQYPTPGGVTATLRQDGYGWDLGPLLLDGFGPGDRGTRVLEELGVASQVQTVREDRGLAFPDFSCWKPADYQGPYWRREMLKQLYPDESQNLDEYYRYYDQVLDLFSLLRQSENAHGLSSLVLSARLWLGFQPLKKLVDINASQLMDSYFHHAEIKAFFLGIVADFVTKPSEFPALGVPSIHLETAFDKRIPAYPGVSSARAGYSYILGGCQSLVQAVMGALQASGGEVLTDTLIEKIVIENGRASGVILPGGHFEPADLVIASGGAHETFYGMVGREYLPQELCADLDRTRYMESVFMVHLGIDFDPRPCQPAALCYYYGTYDLEGAIDNLRTGVYHEGKEGFLVYVPSLHSPQLAPPGHYAMTLYTVAPDRLAESDWETRKEEYADNLVAEAEKVIPGLRQHTRVRVVLSPDDFRQRTHQNHHSFGGVPPVIGNKPPGHRTPIPGLWFIGSQSESGGGVQNVMLGGQKAAKMILAETAR